jgi:hypothetical protein
MAETDVHHFATNTCSIKTQAPLWIVIGYLCLRTLCQTPDPEHFHVYSSPPRFSSMQLLLSTSCFNLWDCQQLLDSIASYSQGNLVNSFFGSGNVWEQLPIPVYVWEQLPINTNAFLSLEFYLVLAETLLFYDSTVLELQCSGMACSDHRMVLVHTPLTQDQRLNRKHTLHTLILLVIDWRFL